jgi:hypothetical protein
VVSRLLDVRRLLEHQKIMSPRITRMRAAPTPMPASVPAPKPPSGGDGASLGAGDADCGLERDVELCVDRLDFGVPEPVCVVEGDVIEELGAVDATVRVTEGDALGLIDVAEPPDVEAETAAVLLATKFAASNVPHLLLILVEHWSCPVWSLA